MSNTLAVTNLLNETIQSIRNVIPVPHTVGNPAVLSNSLFQSEMGVIIGFTGDVQGRLLLEGYLDSFGFIGSSMFGMPLEGEMLESFTGELGNMVAGHLSTALSQHQISIDITPPTVLVGHTKISGFKKALQFPVSFEETKNMNLTLLLEE